MYLIFLQESMNHSGVLMLRMAASISSVTPRPLRTLSMVLKEMEGSPPRRIR